MKVSIEEMAQPFLIRIIEEDKETIQQKTGDIWKSVKNDIGMDGFRQGHVPQNVAEAKFGFQKLYSSYINDLVLNAVKSAETDSGRAIVDVQQVYPERLSKDGIVMQAIVYLKPTVTVDYNNLQVEKRDATVSDEQVQDQVEQLREAQALQVPVTDRGVQFGDTVVLSYVGSINGVPFKGGSASRQQIVLMQGSFIPGFGEQIIGILPEQSKTITVTFPEDYAATQLAGKQADFDITVHEISLKNLPDVNDEFAQTCGYESLDQMKTNLKADIQKRQDAMVRSEIETALVTQLLGKADVSAIPQSMINRYLDQMLNQQLNQVGLTEAEFFKRSNSDRDKFNQTYYHIAKRDIKVQLLLDYIASQEKFVVTDEEYEDYVSKEASRQGYTVADFKSMTTKEQIDSRVKMSKAYDYLLEHATYVDPQPATEAQG